MFTTDDEYTRDNSGNLPLPLQVQFSWKTSKFLLFFIGFVESTLSFEHFREKKSEPHSLIISKIIEFSVRSYLNA